MAKVNLNKISKDKIAWAYKLSEEKFLYDWAAMQTDRREKDRALKKFEARVYALKSEVEAQKTEVESQKAEVESQKTEIAAQKAELARREAELQKNADELKRKAAVLGITLS